ncbi:MAG TPA: hypothetical protein GYA10_04345 [Alphaproteobacteria bacterium]|nr:hypothetical protein [Alphaproteobacteria bacterium]
MPQATVPKPTAARSARRNGRPFFGMLEAVLVEEPAEFDFDGAILRAHAHAAWTWMVRDLAPDLIDPDADDSHPAALPALEALMPDLLARARAAVAETETNPGTLQRLRIQLGGEEPHRKLPIVLNALKCRNLLDKAQSFGRATNTIQDEAALAAALQSMPLHDRALAALLMQAAIGQVANPARLVTAAIRLAGSPSEAAVVRIGFTPLIDAILAHAQNQIRPLSQVGPFADIDLTCRAIDRFHRLARAISGYIELGRVSRWATILSALTKRVSEQIEPRLRDVVMDVNKALRRHREGADRLDSDQLLTALNGIYVLATVRDARDSLALNALFDQTWAQVGQALEIHIQRNLDLYRHDPSDRITGERLEAAIKMAELRFNADYAEVLRRAKETAEKR